MPSLRLFPPPLGAHLISEGRESLFLDDSFFIYMPFLLSGFPVINSDPPLLSAYSPPTAGDRNLSPPERQSLDEVDGSMLQVSYLSSRKMWSAADSTDCPLGAPHLPQKEPASDPQVNGESKTSRGRTALKPGRSVRNGSAGPKRFVGTFFNGFRRSGASSKKTSHTKKASTARFNAATKSVEAEDASSLEGSKPGGRIEFDFRKPFWQRSFSAARNKEGGGRPRHVRPKRNAPDAPDLSGKQLAPQTHNLSWRRVFGMDGEDKDPKERADGASTFTSTKTSSSREVFDDVESSDDETTENSSSSGHNKPPPPKAPVMMRGHSQRVAHLSVAVASERRPHCQAAPSERSTSASFPASSGCAIKEPDLRRSRTPATLLNRKVRFEVPSSDLSDSSDSRSPLVSPRAKPGTIDAPKRSTAAIVEAQRGLSGKSVKNTETASQASQELPRPTSEEALSPSLANPAGETKPMLASNVSQKLPRPASEEALPPSLANPAEAYLVKDDQETGAGRRKLHRRYSSDDGSLVARMAVKNEAGSLLLAERGSIQCAEDAATIEMQMAVMWTTGAYSPTKFASVGAPCRTNNMVSSQRSILSSSGGNVLGPLGHANRDGRSLRHTPRAIANRRLADKIDSAAALAPTWLPPADDDIGRDTLEKIYRFLASSFALTDGQDKQRGCQLAAEALEKLPATVASGTPPPVWVTRYVDKSMKYGLGFLLSDGSVGVRFNDATKIVLEATGGAFEYVDRQQKKPPAQIGTEEGVEETVGLLHPWRIPRPRQGLRDHAPRLEKKVRLLKYFHKDLRKLGGDSYHDSEGKEEGTLGEPATPAGESSGPTEPLTVVEKWRRTRHSCLFLLSTLTVQARQEGLGRGGTRRG